MANRLQMVCVVRKIKGHEEYVPATDVMERGQKFEDGEPMFSGVFDTDIQSDGPSGSDKRRVCIPVGEMTRFTAGSCVLREIKPGDTQWVPVAEAGQLRKGERVQVGMFNSDRERCGPSGSHERTVCTATPLVTETVI